MLIEYREISILPALFFVEKAKIHEKSVRKVIRSKVKYSWKKNESLTCRCIVSPESKVLDRRVTHIATEMRNARGEKGNVSTRSNNERGLCTTRF